MLRRLIVRLLRPAAAAASGAGLLLWCAAVVWCHDPGGLHLHAPDLSGPRSSTGVLWAAVVGALVFGFFGGCAVMLVLDYIRERRDRRELQRSRAREAQAESANR